MALEAGEVERARELLQKALAAKDSKEALKICENFELQVSPARARVVVRFAASAAQGAEPPAARRAKRGRARARAGSLTGAGSGTSGRDHSAARWRAPAGSCAHWSAEIPLTWWRETAANSEASAHSFVRPESCLGSRIVPPFPSACEPASDGVDRAVAVRHYFRPDCAVLFRAVSRVLPLVRSPCAALWDV